MSISFNSFLLSIFVIHTGIYLRKLVDYICYIQEK